MRTSPQAKSNSGGSGGKIRTKPLSNKGKANEKAAKAASSAARARKAAASPF